MAGAGAGKRACVSESQSMLETGRALRQKFTLASVIPKRSLVLTRKLFARKCAKWLKRELHIARKV